MQADGTQADGTPALRRRLWWLICGRFVGVAFLLLLYLRLGETAGARALHSPLVVGVTALAAALLYVLMLRFTRVSLTVQAGVQACADIWLVSWLVAVGGDLHSPFVALYIVVIALASIYLGVRGALVCSVGCAAGYTAVMLGIGFGWFGTGGEAGSGLTTTLASTTGLYDVAFLFVGLLAAQLAQRQTRADVQLIQATHALTNLRALHERIVESIRSGVVTTDLQGRIYTCNAAAEEITGYTADALRGAEASILFGPLAGRIEESLRAVAEGQI